MSLKKGAISPFNLILSTHQSRLYRDLGLSLLFDVLATARLLEVDYS